MDDPIRMDDDWGYPNFRKPSYDDLYQQTGLPSGNQRWQVDAIGNTL